VSILSERQRKENMLNLTFLIGETIGGGDWCIPPYLHFSSGIANNASSQTPHFVKTPKRAHTTVLAVENNANVYSTEESPQFFIFKSLKIWARFRIYKIARQPETKT
jgi:hypothetical protein